MSSHQKSTGLSSTNLGSHLGSMTSKHNLPSLVSRRHTHELDFKIPRTLTCVLYDSFFLTFHGASYWFLLYNNNL